MCRSAQFIHVGTDYHPRNDLKDNDNAGYQTERYPPLGKGPPGQNVTGGNAELHGLNSDPRSPGSLAAVTCWVYAYDVLYTWVGLIHHAVPVTMTILIIFGLPAYRVQSRWRRVPDGRRPSYFTSCGTEWELMVRIRGRRADWWSLELVRRSPRKRSCWWLFPAFSFAIAGSFVAPVSKKK